MLTIKQPVHYGYKSAHDLPTPPSTSRTSPPLIYQDPISKNNYHQNIHRSSSSPSSQLMSAPIRGLPPPAAMTHPHQPAPPQHLPSGPGPQQPHPQGPPQPQPPPPPPSSAPTPSQTQHYNSQLPSAPPFQPGYEEPLRSWLLAKAEEEKRRQEEEKRKQEEEKTRQENLRLEQRRVEQEILRQSLNGGVPPPLIPVLFAGIGGVGGQLNQATIEWAQQYFISHQQPPQQGGHPQLMPPQGIASPAEARRESQPQGYAQYPQSVVPSTPGSAPPQSFGYPASPRTRGQSMSVARPVGGSGSNLPSLNTGFPQGQTGPPTAVPGHSTHPQSGPAQQEQGSPIFHHWVPPASSSAQPATPSGEYPKKRKATGPQPGPATQRPRSPPFAHTTGSTLSNPPPGRRRGHARQRSDFSSYRPAPGRGRMDSVGPQRAPSPGLGSGPGFSREGTASESSHHAQHAPHPQHPPHPVSQSTRTGAHSVSSLLSSDHPSPRMPPYPPAPAHHQPPPPSEIDRQNSPRHQFEDQSRGSMAAPSATKRERDP